MYSLDLVILGSLKSTGLHNSLLQSTKIYQFVLYLIKYKQLR